MRVQEFSDNDILNYLMSSEFNEGFTEEEFKFLLHKFRYFYRLTHGRQESMKYDFDVLKNELHSEQEKNKRKFNQLVQEKVDIETKLNQLVSRKLTWRERIKGKIIIK